MLASARHRLAASAGAFFIAYSFSLAITAVIVVAMTALIGTYVYARSADFDH